MWFADQRGGFIHHCCYLPSPLRQWWYDGKDGRAPYSFFCSRSHITLLFVFMFLCWCLPLLGLLTSWRTPWQYSHSLPLHGYCIFRCCRPQGKPSNMAHDILVLVHLNTQSMICGFSINDLSIRVVLCYWWSLFSWKWVFMQCLENYQWKLVELNASMPLTTWFLLRFFCPGL